MTPDEQEARKAIKRMCTSLMPKSLNLLSKLDKAAAEELPEGAEKPHVSLTEHGPYKPIRVDSECLEFPIPFAKIKVGEEFWAWSHAIRPHTDGSAVFKSCNTEVFRRPQDNSFIIRFVKLPKAIACQDWLVREVLRGEMAKDYSYELGCGKVLPVVCLEHASSCLEKALIQAEREGLPAPDKPEG